MGALGPAIAGLKTLKVPKNHQRTDGQDVSSWRGGKHKPRIKTQVVAHGTTLAGAPGLPLITHPDGQSEDKRPSPDSSGVGSADIFTKNSFSVASPQQRRAGAPLPRVTYGAISSKAGDQRRRVRHVTTVTLHERGEEGGGCFFKAERQRLHLMNYLQQRGQTRRWRSNIGAAYERTHTISRRNIWARRTCIIHAWKSRLYCGKCVRAPLNCSSTQA